MKGIDDLILNMFFYPLKFVELGRSNQNINKTIIYNKNSKKVIIILAQWMGRLIFYKILINKLKKNYNLVVYKLPNTLLNENPEDVVKVFNEAKREIMETMNMLENEGFKDFSIFGTSLSSVLALMVANSDKRVKKIIVGFAGSYLSKSFWDSNHFLVKHIKRVMETKGTDSIKLNKLWENLEPINNIKNIKDRKLYLYLAKNDKITPYKYARELLAILDKENIDFECYIDNIFGHYILGFKQLLFPKRIIKFLEN